MQTQNKNSQKSFTAINWWWVIGCALLAEVVGFASNLLCGDVKGFYVSLHLPPLSPPGWLFGVVWAVLYAVMGGLAGWLVSNQKLQNHHYYKRAVYLYWAQLAVNFCWSPIFFRWHNFPLAVIVVLVLVAMNFYLTYCLSKIHKTAAYLTIPYLAWLLFASYLTVGVCLMN